MEVDIVCRRIYYLMYIEFEDKPVALGRIIKGLGIFKNKGEYDKARSIMRLLVDLGRVKEKYRNGGYYYYLVNKLDVKQVQEWRNGGVSNLKKNMENDLMDLIDLTEEIKIQGVKNE